MFKGLNILEFTEKFSTDDDCRQYLSSIKWQNGYQCGKCGCTHHYLVKKVGTRLCGHCKYAESATSRTLFHKVKFSLRKAFYIVFMMSCGKKGYPAMNFPGNSASDRKPAGHFSARFWRL